MLRLNVPATTTNFGSGFDTFGLALDLFNTFEIEESKGFEVHVEGYGQDLPRDENNLLIKVYKRACKVFGVKERPLKVKQINRVPTARGLGSSATAIVGGIEACLRINNLDVPLEDKLKVAFEFESHPDNLLPAFLGGFVICVQDEERIIYKRLNFPSDISLIFAVPDYEVSTQEARKVLKKSVPIEDAVFNIQRASLLVSALLSKDYSLLKVGVQDRLHQPYRSSLVKGLKEVMSACYREGALAVFLSGAGPTICAMSFEKDRDKVAEVMREVLISLNVEVRILKLKPSERGVFAERS